MSKLSRFVILISVFFMISYALNAKTSSETNQFPIRGESVAEVSGFIVSDIHFRLADNPSYIKAVEFELDGPASQVMVGFDHPSNRFFSCRKREGHSWICDLDEIDIVDVHTIKLIATG